MTLEGIDYSTAYPGAQLIKQAGKRFVVRYLADDDRGLTSDEYIDLVQNDIEVVVIYEGTADRALSGYDGGRFDAEYANGKLISLGGPPNGFIYFNADDTDDQIIRESTLVSYFSGILDVMPLPRTGMYGSYLNMILAEDHGLASKFWQTVGWSGGNIFPDLHILQYQNGGITLNGTVCDLDRAYQDDYGQLSRASHPRIMIQPLPWKPDALGIHKLNGVDVNVFRARVTTLDRAVAVRFNANKESTVVQTIPPHTGAVCLGAYFSGVPNHKRLIYLIETPYGPGRAWASGFKERHYAPPI